MILFLINCLNFNLLTNSTRLYTNILDEIKIIKCYFIRFITYNGNGLTEISINGNYGGILYCYQIKVNLTIDSSYFKNCSSNGPCGSIFFNVTMKIVIQF